MRQGIVGLCLAGLLFAVPVGQARAVDAGAFRGSYSYTGSGPSYDTYRFSRIDFDGTVTAGTKRYTGNFHVLAGMTARGEDYDCGSFGCLDLNGWFLPTTLFGFGSIVIRGTANGQSLKGACQGGRADVDWPKRDFLFRCSISVAGSGLKPVVIKGTATDVDSTLFADGKGFAGSYTVGVQ